LARRIRWRVNGEAKVSGVLQPTLRGVLHSGKAAAHHLDSDEGFDDFAITAGWDDREDVQHHESVRDDHDEFILIVGSEEEQDGDIICHGQGIRE
jgi:hypothetical protein